MRSLLLAVLLAGCGGGVSFAPGDGEWPARPVASWTQKGRFVLTVNLDDTLAFVSADARAPELYGTTPVGNVPVELEGPHHIAGAPDGRFMYLNLSNYVPGTGSGPHGAHGLGTVPGSLIRVDARTGEKRGEALVDRSPGEVILSKDGQTAYVSHYDLLRLTQQLTTGGPPESGYSAVAIVDTATMQRLALLPVCPTAHGMGLSADEKTLYVTCSLSDELAILDVSDRARPTITRKLPVGPSAGTPGMPVYSPYALKVSPKDGSVWISNNLSGDVRVYDPQTEAMDPARVVQLNGVAMFGAFSNDGAFFFVPSQGNEQITRIDTATLQTQILALQPEACKNAHVFEIAPDGQNAVLVCEGDHVAVPGTAVFATVEPLAVAGYVEVGLFPDGAAYLPPAPK